MGCDALKGGTRMGSKGGRSGGRGYRRGLEPPRLCRVCRVGMCGEMSMRGGGAGRLRLRIVCTVIRMMRGNRVG